MSRDRVDGLLQLYKTLDHDRTYAGQSLTQMYMTSFIQHAIDQGWGVKAVPIANGWLEVDTVADLEFYGRMQAEGTLVDYYEIVLVQ